MKARSASPRASPTRSTSAIAPMNGKKVTDQITLTTDKGNGTPTGDAIKQAVAYFES